MDGGVTSDIRREPVTEASAWRGRDLEADRSWEYTLTDEHIGELEKALDQAADASLIELDLASFRHPALTELMRSVRRDVQYGRGIALLHDFPVAGHSYAEIERLYWGLGSHVGTGVTQNSDAALIHYVTDGKLRPQMGKRTVGHPDEVGLHADMSDVVSLLCVRQAPDDPYSRLASSMHIYNELLRQRPDALERLYEGFEWDRHDEHADHETPTSVYKVPVYSHKDGVVTCRYNPGWIKRAYQRLERSLTDEETEIFSFMNSIAAEACIAFPFHAGDIQFANNYTVLHGRAGHGEVSDEDRKRVLMRLWLDFDKDTRPYVHEGLVRYGVVRHGALGWTAGDLAAGRHREPRKRTDKGVSIV
jgi:hypothetical protein